jgi:hypothetical protein
MYARAAPTNAQMYKVACTRFNTETWSENEDWRRRHKHSGCIYGSPTDITETTTTATSTVFVIEMNNDANRVMGVGKLVISAGAGVGSTSTTNSKVNGRARTDGRVFNVYSRRNYNRYKFVGSERVDRETEIDSTPALARVFARLDGILFRSARHCKRGQGIQSIPKWISSAAERRCNYLLWRFFKELFDHLIEARKTRF